jgi:hypothetical protein
VYDEAVHDHRKQQPERIISRVTRERGRMIQTSDSADMNAAIRMKLLARVTLVVIIAPLNAELRN